MCHDEPRSQSGCEERCKGLKQMRAEKKQLVLDIQALLEASPDLFLISYKGLTAEDFNELRERLASIGGGCHVVPNRLFRRATLAAGLEALAEAELKEDNALVMGGEDVVAVAKVLKEFAKEHDQVAVRCGVVDGRFCPAEAAAQLADLPPREVLLAQLLGLLEAPAAQLVRVLNAKVASIVYVLNAYLSKKEEAA